MSESELTIEEIFEKKSLLINNKIKLNSYSYDKPTLEKYFNTILSKHLQSILSNSNEKFLIFNEKVLKIPVFQEEIIKILNKINENPVKIEYILVNHSIIVYFPLYFHDEDLISFLKDDVFHITLEEYTEILNEMIIKGCEFEIESFEEYINNENQLNKPDFNNNSHENNNKNQDQTDNYNDIPNEDDDELSVDYINKLNDLHKEILLPKLKIKFILNTTNFDYKIQTSIINKHEILRRNSQTSGIEVMTSNFLYKKLFYIAFDGYSTIVSSSYDADLYIKILFTNEKSEDFLQNPCKFQVKSIKNSTSKMLILLFHKEQFQIRYLSLLNQIKYNIIVNTCLLFGRIYSSISETLLINFNRNVCKTYKNHLKNHVIKRNNMDFLCERVYDQGLLSEYLLYNNIHEKVDFTNEKQSKYVNLIKFQVEKEYFLLLTSNFNLYFISQSHQSNVQHINHDVSSNKSVRIYNFVSHSEFFCCYFKEDSFFKYGIYSLNQDSSGKQACFYSDKYIITDLNSHFNMIISHGKLITFSSSSSSTEVNVYDRRTEKPHSILLKRDLSRLVKNQEDPYEFYEFQCLVKIFPMEEIENSFIFLIKVKTNEKNHEFRFFHCGNQSFFQKKQKINKKPNEINGEIQFLSEIIKKIFVFDEDSKENLSKAYNEDENDLYSNLKLKFFSEFVMIGFKNKILLIEDKENTIKFGFFEKNESVNQIKVVLFNENNDSNNDYKVSIIHLNSCFLLDFHVSLSLNDDFSIVYDVLIENIL